MHVFIKLGYRSSLVYKTVRINSQKKKIKRCLTKSLTRMLISHAYISRHQYVISLNFLIEERAVRGSRANYLQEKPITNSVVKRGQLPFYNSKINIYLYSKRAMLNRADNSTKSKGRVTSVLSLRTSLLPIGASARSSKSSQQHLHQ